MLGLSFIHAGFLAAGLAVAVPVLIHLLFRQRAREVPLGSVRFLLEVVRQHQRKRRVRQWLLLALRTLAILLLVLLFARPFFVGSKRAGVDEEVVVLVDRSASMRARGTGQSTAFERAMEEAQREARRLGENTAVHWAWFDAGGVQESSIEDFFSGKSAGWLGTDYGLALGWAGELLASGGRSKRRVVLCTDLQRGAFERSTIAALEPGVTLEVRDVGDSVVSDLAIIAAEVPRTEIRPGEPIQVRAIVRNGGALPVRRATVDVRLTGPSGELHATKAFDVAGGAAEVVDVKLDIKVPGIYRGTASVEQEDALDWDNRRFVAFEARLPDRVLLVDGQEGRSVFGNETYFLETALRLRSNDSAERVGAFEVERIVWDAGEGFPSLTGFRAIVLANVRRVTTEDVERLTDFVQAGGSLVVFGGELTTAAVLEPLQEAGLLGGDAVGEATVGRFRVDRWEVAHPWLAIFSDPQRGDLRRLEFKTIVPLTPGAEDQTLLSAGGRAIAVERQVGKGRTIYFGSTADRDWTDWPRTRLYVPMVRQLMAYATGALAERSPVVQETIVKGEQEPGIRDQDGKIVASNVDPAESRLERGTADDLAAAAGTKVEDTASQDETRRAALLAAPGAERPEEIWTYVLWGLFAVLAGELFLAGRIHN